MRGQTTESLATLLGAYEETAQAQSPAVGNGLDWGSTVAECLKLPAVSEAVQRLASLQPEMLMVLHSTREAAIARHIIGALRSLSVLGVLHPSSAMPCLLAVCFAGCQAVNEPARRLVLRLLESSPRLFASRLSAGLQAAASKLLADGACHGSLTADKWRFTLVCEAYNERLDSQAARQHVINTIMEEFEALSCTAHQSSQDMGAQSSAIVLHQGDAAGGMEGLKPLTPAHILMRAELLAGILSFLPYHGALEVAHVMLKAARLLTLRVLPLLAEGSQGGARARGTSLFGTCAVAAVLHALCAHLAPGASEMERLIAAGLQHEDGESAEDQQLPPCFWRRPALSAERQLQELAGAAGDEAGLLRALQGLVPLDSPLLRGAGGPRLGANSRGKEARRQGRGRGKRAAGGGGDEDVATEGESQRRSSQPAQRRRKRG